MPLRCFLCAAMSVLMISVSLGCDRDHASTQAAPSAAAAGSPTESAARDKDALWTRSAQCAAQAERVYERHARENSRADAAQPFHFLNHYNAQQQRCFVLVRWMNPRSTAKRRSIPMFYAEVFDAFENREIGAFSEENLDDIAASVFCRMENEKRERTSPGCEKVRAYIDVLMAQ